MHSPGTLLLGPIQKHPFIALDLDVGLVLNHPQWIPGAGRAERGKMSPHFLKGVVHETHLTSLAWLGRLMCARFARLQQTRRAHGGIRIKLPLATAITKPTAAWC